MWGADREVRQLRGLGDAPVRPADGEQPQQLAFTRRQGPHAQLDAGVAARRRFGHGHRHLSTCGEVADGGCQLPAGPGFGQASIGASGEHRRGRLRVSVTREHQQLGRRRGPPGGGHGLGQVAGWQVRVQHQHRRLMLSGRLDGLAGVVGQVEHGEVILGIQEHAKPLSNHHMMVGEHQRHRIGHNLSPNVVLDDRRLANPGHRSLGGRPVPEVMDGGPLPILRRCASLHDAQVWD
jgi:hypothetical protein